MRASSLTFLALLTFAVAPLPSFAAIIHVPDGQPTIQAGIDAASAGDTVLVACGTYYEHDIEMKSGVYLTGETGQADCVAVDAQELGRGFDCSLVDSTASVCGFTIRSGIGVDGGGVYCQFSSLTFRDCFFENNYSSTSGGALYLDVLDAPRVVDCQFVANEASYGGGALYSGGSCSPSLDRCVFTGNRAEGHGGGGAFFEGSTGEVNGTIFVGNETTGWGGGICCDGSSPTLTGCTFEGNTAFIGGGASVSASSPMLAGCTFEGNTAVAGGGLYYAQSGWPNPLTLTQCTFSGNAAPDGGGLRSDSESTTTMENCIIAFSTDGAGLVCAEGSTAALTCCDIYGNAGGDWVGCIADQYGVAGNFSEDPLFCDMANDDFTLCANSPCLPENSDCEVLIGAYGEGCGPCDSPVEVTSWGAIKAMYR